MKIKEEEEEEMSKHINDFIEKSR